MSEPKQLYGGRPPKGYLAAHNHVAHTPGFRHGTNGFRRFWIPPEEIKSGEWEVCPCGWRGDDPKWCPHYARAEHVVWWKSEIAKRGSLEAVYRNIERMLYRRDERLGLLLPANVAEALGIRRKECSSRSRTV